MSSLMKSVAIVLQLSSLGFCLVLATDETSLLQLPGKLTKVVEAKIAPHKSKKVAAAQGSEEKDSKESSYADLRERVAKAVDAVKASKEVEKLATDADSRVDAAAGTVDSQLVLMNSERALLGAARINANGIHALKDSSAVEIMRMEVQLRMKATTAACAALKDSVDALSKEAEKLTDSGSKAKWTNAVKSAQLLVARAEDAVKNSLFKAADLDSQTEQESLDDDLYTIGTQESVPLFVTQLGQLNTASDALPLGLHCPKSATRGWPAAASLSAEQLRRGAVNLNGAARFRTLLGKLQSKSSGQKLNILVVGGSVEQPNFQVDYAQKWPSLVAKWLGESSSSGVEPVLSYFSMQDHSQQLVSPTSFTMDDDWRKLLNAASNYDLVFVSGALNSPLMGKAGFSGPPFSLVKDATVRRRFDEAVLRSLLEHPKSPAVMLVNWFLDEELFESQGATIQEANPGTFLATNGLEWKYGTWEDDSYNFLATYYEISMVSGRSALLHSTDLESISGTSLGPRFKSTDVFTDGLHPTVLGQALLSQIVQFGICEQFHILQDSLTASKAQPTANNTQLPPAVFADADRQLELRHATDLSGFSSIEHVAIVKASKEKIPGLGRPKATWILSAEGQDSQDETAFNRTGNSSMLPWDLRVTVLPLIILEACALFGVNQGAPLAVGENPGLHTLALEPFRFLGVLHIVLMHDITDVKDQSWWQIASTFGKYWVQFFYALSGLVLYISQRGAENVPDPASFIMKRVWGIYPVYGLSILCAMLAKSAPGNYLSEVPHATWNYLSHDILPGLLLVDSWAWPYGPQTPNGPTWFVCTLFAFWLCFPHWYHFIRGVRWPKLVMLLAYLSTFGLPVLYAAKNVDRHCHPRLCANWSSFAEFHPFANWQVFVFGMCMGRVLQDTNSEAVPLTLRRMGGTVSLLMVFSLPLFSPTPSDSVLTLFFDKGPLLLPIFGMLLYFLPLGDDILLRPAFMESKLLAYAGAMSGHLFLLHMPVKYFMEGKRESGAVPITAMLPLQLLLSIVGYEAHTRLLGPLRSVRLKPTPA